MVPSGAAAGPSRKKPPEKTESSLASAGKMAPGWKTACCAEAGASDESKPKASASTTDGDDRIMGCPSIRAARGPLMDERRFEPPTPGIPGHDRPRRIAAGSPPPSRDLNTRMPRIRSEIIMVRFHRLAPVALAAAMAFVGGAEAGPLLDPSMYGAIAGTPNATVNGVTFTSAPGD